MKEEVIGHFQSVTIWNVLVAHEGKEARRVDTVSF
jgi:hypothetical protein